MTTNANIVKKLKSKRHGLKVQLGKARKSFMAYYKRPRFSGQAEGLKNRREKLSELKRQIALLDEILAG